MPPSHGAPRSITELSTVKDVFCSRDKSELRLQEVQADLTNPTTGGPVWMNRYRPDVKLILIICINLDLFCERNHLSQYMGWVLTRVLQPAGLMDSRDRNET